MESLYGRRAVTSGATAITRENVLNEVVNAYATHLLNFNEEDYLYDYYRGKQEIRFKTKETRKSINHKVCENYAWAIVDFATGYIAGDPIIYTSDSTSSVTSNAISQLNDWMSIESKTYCDKSLFDWMHICGLGYRIALPNADYNGGKSESPFIMEALDPRTTFVIRNNGIRKKPIAAVTYVLDSSGDIVFSVYTPDAFYKIARGKITDEQTNPLGMIPIIEYRLNEARIGRFENAICLIDAINDLSSDRCDAVTQFVNSLLVLYNAELPDGEDSESVRDKGLICLKAVGESKADIKIISEQLDQTQNQTLKNDLYLSMLRIVGMPSQGDGNSSDSSNNGAVFLKQGFQLAEVRAKAEEQMYRKGENEMLKVILRICEMMGVDTIEPSDIAITFTRRAYSDLSTKATVLTQLLGSDLVAPSDAWELSGITPDPDEATKRGLAWREENKVVVQPVVPNTNEENEVDNNENPVTD